MGGTWRRSAKSLRKDGVSTTASLLGIKVAREQSLLGLKMKVRRTFRLYAFATLAVLGIVGTIYSSYFGAAELNAGQVVSRRALRGTSDYNDACDKNGYPPEDMLFGRGLFKCDAMEGGATILYVFGVVYMFLALAIVCDEYFVPALEALVERWQIDDDVAGATFMAAGGSAPELFTSLIGTFAESSVGFGTIVGSAVFNVLFVIGVCAIASVKLLELEWWPLFRDCSYYAFGLGALSLFFGSISPNEIELWESLVLLGLYGGYVLLMKYHLAVHKAICLTLGLEHKKPRTHEFLNHGVMQFLKNNLNLHMEVHMVLGMGGECEVTKFKNMDKGGKGKIDRETLKAELMQNSHFANQKDKEAFVDRLMEQADTDKDGHIDEAEFRTWYKQAKEKINEAVHQLFKALDIDENGRLSKEEATQLMTQAAGDHPLTKAEVELEWNKMAKLQDDATNPPTQCIDVAIFTDWYHQFIAKTEQKGFKMEGHDPSEKGGDDEEDDDGGWPDNLKGQIMYCVSYPLIFCMSFTLPNPKTEAGTNYAGVGFVGSIIWIGVFSYFMVSWATTVGDVVGIPPEVMGLTFLAAGTSVPDLLSSVIVAQHGKGDMAVSSSVGSNIFDILFGLPFPWLLYSIYKLGKPNVVTATSLITDVLILLGMVMYVILSVMAAGWTMSKRLGSSYFAMYGVFVAQKLIRVYVFDEKD